MNILYYYVEVIKNYFLNRFFLLFTTSVIFFIYIFHFILSLFFVLEFFNFIYWHFISPFFIYISMLFVICIHCHRNSKKKTLNELFHNIIFIGLICIILKLAWNILKVILLESNLIIVREDSSLMPLFFLAFFWLLIYSFVAYFIPHRLMKNKKISLKNFCLYIAQEFWMLLLHLLFSFLFSFLIIILISYVCAQLQFFSFLKTTSIHTFIENILSIGFNVIFAHSISTLLLHTYLEHYKNNGIK
jgi:hypothetical protein